MSRPDPVRPATFADVARLDEDLHGGELAAGSWTPVTRGTWRHGEVVANAVVALKLWARANPGWSVATADPGTRLSRAPDTLRGPDVGVVRSDRRPTAAGVEGWLDGAPDVVLEVAGDAQAPTELVRKALEYLQAGARLVWVVDPEARQVVVYRTGNVVELIREDGALDGGDVLPGFTCPLADLFA